MFWSQNFKTHASFCSWAVRFDSFLVAHPRKLTWLILYKNNTEQQYKPNHLSLHPLPVLLPSESPLLNWNPALPLLILHFPQFPTLRSNFGLLKLSEICSWELLNRQNSSKKGKAGFQVASSELNFFSFLFWYSTFLTLHPAYDQTLLRWKHLFLCAKNTELTIFLVASTYKLFCSLTYRLWFAEKYRN